MNLQVKLPNGSTKPERSSSGCAKVFEISGKARRRPWVKGGCACDAVAQDEMKMKELRKDTVGRPGRTTTPS